jgi:hypothetical protein
MAVIEQYISGKKGIVEFFERFSKNCFHPQELQAQYILAYLTKNYPGYTSREYGQHILIEHDGKPVITFEV